MPLTMSSRRSERPVEARSSARADVRDKEQIAAMVEAAVAMYGGIDILVNNAGILHSGDIESFVDEDLDRMIDVNVKGIIHCTRAVMGLMIDKELREDHQPRARLPGWAPPSPGRPLTD